MRPQPKPERFLYPKYLEWIKTQKCVVCGKYATIGNDVVPAHQNIGYGKMGGKSHDFFAIPLCHLPCHTAFEHNQKSKLFTLYKETHGVAPNWPVVVERAIKDHIWRFLTQ